MFTTGVICTIIVAGALFFLGYYVLYHSIKDTYYGVRFRWFISPVSWLDVFVCIGGLIIGVCLIWGSYWLFPLKFVVITSVL